MDALILWVAVGLYIGFDGGMQQDMSPLFETQAECVAMVESQTKRAEAANGAIAYALTCVKLEVIVKGDDTAKKKSSLPVPILPSCKDVPNVFGVKCADDI